MSDQDFSDAKLSAEYQALDTPEPPAVIDDAIRAAARRSVAAGPTSINKPRSRRWLPAFALAATVVLAVTVITRLPQWDRPWSDLDLSGVPAPVVDSSEETKAAPPTPVAEQPGEVLPRAYSQQTGAEPKPLAQKQAQAKSLAPYQPESPGNQRAFAPAPTSENDGRMRYERELRSKESPVAADASPAYAETEASPAYEAAPVLNAVPEKPTSGSALSDDGFAVPSANNAESRRVFAPPARAEAKRPVLDQQKREAQRRTPNELLESAGSSSAAPTAALSPRLREKSQSQTAPAPKSFQSAPIRQAPRPPAVDLLRRGASESTPENPNRWISEIRWRLDVGQTEAAIALIAGFSKHFPDQPLPADLRAAQQQANVE